ncbi:tyrosine/serine/threonine protein phosphatase pps1, partial [Modicella reniformis]
TFAAFESKYPELIAVSSTGKANRNKVDFWEQEREQMAFLTRASEIAPGIWLGNNSDVPHINSGASSLATPVSPGSSFSSYFFPSSIPSTLQQEPPGVNSSAIPSTPPPEESEYPPLTPPSFNDHSTFQPSICIECRSSANAPITMTLDRIKNNITYTPAPLLPKEIFHLECLGTLSVVVHPEAFPPSMSSLSNFARPDIDIATNYSMRRATATALVKGQQLTSSTLQAHLTNLVNMAFFIHTVTHPDSSICSSSSSSSSNNGTTNGFVGQQHHQVLIHCVDGYTESALLALSVVMIHYRIPLAEAYLKLQTDLGRSFFVYPNDAIMMLEVENQIWQRLVLEKSERESAAKWNASMSAAPLSPPASAADTAPPPLPSSSLPVVTTSELNTASAGSDCSIPSPSEAPSPTPASSLSSSSSSFFSSLLNMSNQPQQQEEQQEQAHDGNSSPTKTTTTTTTTMTTTSTTTMMTTSTTTSSGPTPLMMTMLMEGIEPMPDRDEELASQRPFVKPGHIERFEWFYHPEFEGSFPSRILPFLYLGNLAHASNPGLLRSLGIRYVLSVGEEARGLNDCVWDTSFSTVAENEQGARPKATTTTTTNTRFMVKLVDDMFDNGVDSLWKHLENCVDFVDEARKSNSRVLIHCRVGVSRSATIVIAYLMAHYNLSLVEAYLMVRARRLSVIIQPNLLFMYELLQWEQRLRGRFDPMGWPGIAREVHGLNMYYIGN